jgi:DNA replication protein DnaC
METTDYMDEMVNRAIEEQNHKYREAASDLNIWHCPSLTSQNFWKLLNATAQAIMAQRGVYHAFVVDDNNREIIRQMWLYIAGSKECKWNIHKGIYIGGKVGCGKTLLMQSFCEILHLISGRTVEMIPATLLHERIIHDGIDQLAKRPLFIDELGREQLEISAYGNKIRPIADLMALRYNNGARTFFTSNFKLSTLSRGRNEKGELIGYGQYIGERIQEMTNIVEMPGESRREKWEEEKAL